MKRKLFIFIFCFFFLNPIAKANPRNLELNNKAEEGSAILTGQYNDSPFGVLEFLSWNHYRNNYKYPNRESLIKVIGLMKEAHVVWIRLDFLWDDIEQQKGKLSFQKYDDIVSLLVQNNINILGLLSYSASWAGPSWNSAPYKDEDFVNYVGYVIGRYKDRVKHWEIWNEPDDEQYFIPQDNMSRYTQLLKKVYFKAKQIDPECKILNGGLSKSIIMSLKKIYKNGGRGYFDILAIHPFVNPLNSVDVERIEGLYKACKKIMVENADDKKIWFTELGCPGVQLPSQLNSWWLGISPDEQEQADWVKKVYLEILPKLPDCEKIFWAFFRDCKNYWNNGIDYFGLIRWDFSKKPSFSAYKEAAELCKNSVTYNKPKEKLKGIAPW